MSVAVRMLVALAILLASTLVSGAEPRWSEGQQLIAVISSDWDANSGALFRFERKGKRWHMVGTSSVVSIGRKGSAWGRGLHPVQPGAQKVEGDGRAPAGIFKLGTAFGYAAKLPNGLGYTAMQAEHYCVDVPASPFYNRIVDTREVGAAAIAGSTEPMRRDLHLNGDDLYRMGFVIEHNPEHLDGIGSCIFAHLWRAPAAPTAGCTAMDESSMQTLLGWLDKKRRPRFVLMPQVAYAERRSSWDLPTLP